MKNFKVLNTVALFTTSTELDLRSFFRDLMVDLLNCGIPQNNEQLVDDTLKNISDADLFNLFTKNVVNDGRMFFSLSDIEELFLSELDIEIEIDLYVDLFNCFSEAELNLICREQEFFSYKIFEESSTIQDFIQLFR